MGSRVVTGTVVHTCRVWYIGFLKPQLVLPLLRLFLLPFLTTDTHHQLGSPITQLSYDLSLSRLYHC